MSSVLVLCCVCGILVFILFLVTKFNKSMRHPPPGPTGLPLIGSWLHLNQVNLVEEFEKYRRKYGNIFSLKVGLYKVVVLNGNEIIREAFKEEVFCGRPNFHPWILRNAGIKNRGILFCDANSNVWLEQRRFVLKHLRDFGFGKVSMETHILNQLRQAIGRIKAEQNSSSINLHYILSVAVLNSLWGIVAGKPFDPEATNFKCISAELTKVIDNHKLFPASLFLPWKYKLFGKSKQWKSFTANRKGIIEIFQNTIKEHQQNYQPTTTTKPNDLIQSYIQHISNCKDLNSSFYGVNGYKNLLLVLLDLFFPAKDTTATALLWAIYHLSKDCKLQSKLRLDIREAIGLEKLPTLDDKYNLIYLEAFLQEVLRMHPIFPFGIYHSTIEDVIFKGHTIPKRTVVIANLYGVHHDKDYWGDPEIFRPERFINATGTKIIKHEAYMPFSTGKRLCPGEKFAKDILFLFVTGFLQVFQFDMDFGKLQPEPAEVKSYLTSSPNISNVRVKPI